MVKGSYGWVDVTFSSNPVQLYSGTTYWIVFDVGSASSSKYFIWGASDDSSYTSGTAKLSSSWNGDPPVWNDAGLDLSFKTYMGGITTFIDNVFVGVDAHANTISNSSVGRDAYFQIKINTTVSGVSYPGSPDPGPQNMPLSEGNIAQFKQEAEAGGTQVGDITITSGTQTLGPKKIVGNLTVSNTGHINLTGTVYVTGDINLSNSCRVDLSSAYGPNSGTLLAEGKISIINSCTLNGSGNPSSYLLLLTTNPSQDPASPALNVGNSAQNAILYASQGVLHLANTASLKEAIAQKLSLGNNTEIEYELGLANVNFTSGPGAGYGIVPGSYKAN
jgi:hypothetical protein